MDKEQVKLKIKGRKAMNKVPTKEHQSNLFSAPRLRSAAKPDYAQLPKLCPHWHMTKIKTPTPANPPPATQRAEIDQTPISRDKAFEPQLRMPNERDESVDMTPDSPDPMIEQAAIDVALGLQDTSKGEELNRVYKKLK